MVPSFDYAESSLLCAEEESSIFEHDDADNAFMQVGAGKNDPFLGFRDQGSYGGERLAGLLLVSPMMLESESVGLFLARENEHLPCGGYLSRLRCCDLDLGARSEAVDWIWKVQSHNNFGPQCACLSINYLDRFLSSYKLPLKGKSWMMPLLAFACYSLAAKVEETDIPLPIDLQDGESKFIFEAKTIQRTELVVLSTLKWRMHSVTPLSFIHHFLYELNGGKLTPRSSILDSIHIIRNVSKGIDFLEFKPSEIAAAVAISVTRENEAMETEKAIYCLCRHVEKEKLLRCLELIHDLSSVNGSLKVPSSSTQSVPHSPSGVLDAGCVSYKSDDTPSGSCANSIHNSTYVAKRRKLNEEEQ